MVPVLSIRPSGRILLSIMLAVWCCSLSAAPLTLVHDSYANGHQLRIQGRVVAAPVVRAESKTDGSRTNLQRTTKWLRQKELRKAPVSVRVGQVLATTITDEEGRFGVTLNTAALAPGWHAVETVPAAASAEHVFVPQPRNRYILLSDVDDTVLFSEVNFRRRLLQHSLMENSLQRRSFAGTAAFYQQLARLNAVPEQSTWFYLSASPRQLQEPIQSFLRREQFPRGLLLLKTFTWTGGDPWLDQQRYKRQVLERLLTDFPDRQFILIGDDGEHDPEIYRGMDNAYPGRVAAILIRHVHPDSARIRYAGQCDLAATMAELGHCPALQALVD